MTAVCSTAHQAGSVIEAPRPRPDILVLPRFCQGQVPVLQGADYTSTLTRSERKGRSRSCELSTEPLQTLCGAAAAHGDM